jgi:hypothetical protein
VIKIKAAAPSAPSEVKGKPAEKNASSKSPSSDDWWGKGAGTLADSAQVIQLKATPEEEAESEDEEKP